MAGNWQERIEQKAEVLGGKPVVKGSRLSVEFLLGLMAAEGADCRGWWGSYKMGDSALIWTISSRSSC